MVETYINSGTGGDRQEAGEAAGFNENWEGCCGVYVPQMHNPV